MVNFNENQRTEEADYATVKQRLLTELAQKKQQGLHRQWFEDTYSKFIEMVFQQKRDKEAEKAYLECLQENQVEGYEDRELLQMILDRKNMSAACICLIWYTRDIVHRRLILDCSIPVCEIFLNKFILGDWLTEAERQEAYKAHCLMAMPCITVIPKGDEKGILTDREKAILNCKESVILKNCLENGFLQKEKASEYIDYCMEKGLRELVPPLICFTK